MEIWNKEIIRETSMCVYVWGVPEGISASSETIHYEEARMKTQFSFS